ncbi:MAG: lipopolysaccharide ABC transporter substrate-binding protein LptA [Plesiomonas sp.]|uniref:lipopolysaccharide ABC transporter substrate-binding protein LptA n=1 Tax=Plesiomonas sp. TaxID=2486279 RepID=UPI003EE4C20E
MKLKNRSLLAAFTLVMLSRPAFAVKGDTDQPININSEQQSLDLATNTVVFTGNVVLTQGTIKVTANKVVVIRPKDEKGKEIIEAFGKPATFYQMQDNGKPVDGYADKMRYDLGTDFVELIDNAELKQLDSSVKADRITYLMQKQQMEAFSNKGQRVVTVLQPAQLNNSNKKSSN